jgi:hypothetical protein
LNFTVTVEVPEPTSIATIGSMLIGALSLRRRG